jgi:hypothetical protein
MVAGKTSEKTSELRVMQMYLWSLITPTYVNGRRVGLLARHGAYDVRLIDCQKSAYGDAEPIWIELFDRNNNVSLDSFSGHDFEEAAAAADSLISRAQELDASSQ